MKKIIIFLALFPYIIKPWVQDPQARYAIAIQDAKTITPNELTKDLTAIVPWNHTIKWTPEGNIVVVSYMSLDAVLRYYVTTDLFSKIKAKCKEQRDYKGTNELNCHILSDDFMSVMKVAARKKEAAEEKQKKLLVTDSSAAAKAWIPDLPSGNAMFKTTLVSYPTMISSPNSFRPSWVTIAPELQRFMFEHKSLSQKDLATRINELLGLPPSSDIKYVIEFEINPADLFRPSSSAEITDSEAASKNIHDHECSEPICLYGLKYPTFNPYSTQNATIEQYRVLKQFLETKGYTNVTDENVYQKWFEFNKRDTILNASWPFPWTQIGYTYDYSIEAFKKRNHVGLSEFVIKPESKIKITKITPIRHYSYEYQKDQSALIKNLQKKFNKHKVQLYNQMHTLSSETKTTSKTLDIVNHPIFSNVMLEYNLLLYYQEELQKLGFDISLEIDEITRHLTSFLSTGLVTEAKSIALK